MSDPIIRTKQQDTPAQMAARPAAQRLLSLDAMRGFTIAAMIMVNFPGDEAHVFFTLRHTIWNGLSFTDLIAPTFLFIIGVSITLAYDRHLSNDEKKSELYSKIIIRSLKIFAVGMFLNMLPDFDFPNLRYTGTLHRIALVFLVCATLFLKTHWKQQATIGALLLIGYWLVMTTIPTPGYGQVMLDRGVNLAAWLDQQFLPGKMWQGTWDPEGILSTFPALVSCISGMLAGRLMLTPLAPERKVNYLFLAGFILMAAGYFWGLAFPVNENIWTSSFVLVTSGFASAWLAVMYFVMDILGKKRGAFIGVVFGSNAIAAYVMADLLALIFYLTPVAGATINLQATGFLQLLGVMPELASLFFALFFVAINFIPAYILYRRRIFIKL